MTAMHRFARQKAGPIVIVSLTMIAAQPGW
jgi:hypothetical protein